MQTTILEQVDSSAQQEPTFINSLRTDPRIRSVTVIRNGKHVSHFNSLVDISQDGAKNFEEHMADVLTFLVSDLLRNGSYSVTQREAFYELVFSGKHEQVVVAADLGSDITEIANSITNHLAVITRSN